MPCTDCGKLIDAAKTVTLCECPAPGDCPRHGCRKNAHLHNLCRTRQDYFDLWERGQGPCLGSPARTDPCQHRGEQVSTIGCASCGKTIELKVFACVLHEECTLGNPQDGIACCQNCPDFAAAEAQP